MKHSDLQVNLHSQEVHEILSFIPHWIIRWGITLILGTIVFVLTGAWFIKYPEVVPAQVTITSRNPPRKVIARSSGNINLLVENGSRVKKNEQLGYIESSANFQDVFSLKAKIAGFNQFGDSLKEFIGSSKSQNLSLGELQSDFELFFQNVQSIQQFKNFNFHQRRINQLSGRINDYQHLNQSLNAKKWIAEKEYTINAQKLSMDSTLLKKDAISKKELDDARLVLFQNERSIESANIAILNNRLKIDELKSQVAELRLEHQQEQQELINSLTKSLELFRSRIATWEKQYVLTAPVAGNVTFFDVWSDEQFVKAGDEVMSVVPKEKKLFGVLKMPIARSGKVKEGQKINIRLSNYPYQQYGMLIGRVDKLSLVPKENNYLIYASLPNGLKTTYGKTLEFRQKMRGSAEIITKDLRLLEQIFYQMREFLVEYKLTMR